MYWLVFTVFMCLAGFTNIIADMRMTAYEQAVDIYCMAKYSDPLNFEMANRIEEHVIKVVKESESGPPSVIDCWYIRFNRPVLKCLSIFFGLMGLMTLIHSIRISVENKIKKV